METTKELKEMLEKIEQTGDVTCDKKAASWLLDSCNERAKNCRNRVNELKSEYKKGYCFEDKNDSVEYYRSEMRRYYALKDKLLDRLEPSYMECEYRDLDVKVYDYQAEYHDVEYLFTYRGSYYDKKRGRRVYFGRYFDYGKYEKKYYLCYKVNGYVYHRPIKNYEVKNYPHLTIYKTGKIKTSGKNVKSLVSAQFVNKVMKLLDEAA